MNHFETNKLYKLKLNLIFRFMWILNKFFQIFLVWLIPIGRHYYFRYYFCHQVLQLFHLIFYMKPGFEPTSKEHDSDWESSTFTTWPGCLFSMNCSYGQRYLKYTCFIAILPLWRGPRRVKLSLLKTSDIFNLDFYIWDKCKNEFSKKINKSLMQKKLHLIFRLN